MKKGKYLVAVAGLTMVALCGCGKTKIDLNDYITVDFSGADGYGEANIVFDEDNFIDALPDDVYDESDDSMESYGRYLALCEGISYDLNKAENLKNGDKVELNISWDENVADKLGIKFTSKPETVKVTGLTEVKEIDPFKDVEVIFDGTSGAATVAIKNNSKEDYIKDLEFSADKYDYLSENDIVTVSLNDSQIEDAVNHGYAFTETEKEYKVENIDHYATSYDEISDETKEKMIEQSKEAIEADLAERADFVSYDNLRYVGSYFLSAKGNPTWNAHCMNYDIYAAEISIKEIGSLPAWSGTLYFPVKYTDILVYSDGTDFADISEYRLDCPGGKEYGTVNFIPGYELTDNMYNNIIMQNKGDYTYEVIGDDLKAFGN